MTPEALDALIARMTLTPDELEMLIASATITSAELDTMLEDLRKDDERLLSEMLSDVWLFED